MRLSKCISVAQRASSCVRSVKDHQCHVSIMSERHPLNSDVCHVVNDRVMTHIKRTITHVPHVCMWMAEPMPLGHFLPLQ